MCYIGVPKVVNHLVALGGNELKWGSDRNLQTKQQWQPSGNIAILNGILSRAMPQFFIQLWQIGGVEERLPSTE